MTDLQDIIDNDDESKEKRGTAKKELDKIRKNLDKIKILICGGDAVSVQEMLRMERLFGVTILNGYGNNEVTGAAILFGISLLDTFTEYFYMTLIDVVFLAALFVAWSGSLYLLHKHFPGIRIRLLQRMSHDINKIYCIHWLMIGILCAVKAIAFPDYTPGFMVATVLSAGIMAASVWMTGKVKWKI